MSLSNFRTNPDKELHGVPVVFADYDRVCLTLARSTRNDRLKLEVERVTREFRGRVGPTVDEERESALLLAWCRACILKWETLEDRQTGKYVPGISWDGALLPLTAENARMVFETRGLEDFREQVMFQARNAENFRDRILESDTGN